MNDYLAVLAYRRSVLLEEIEAQRVELEAISLRLKKPLAIADVGMKAVFFVKDHPALLTAGIGGFLAWRESGIVGLAKSGWRLLYPFGTLLGLKYLSAKILSPDEKTHHPK